MGLVFSLLAAGVCFGQAEFDKVEYLKAPQAGQKKSETIDGSLVFDNNKKEIRFVREKTAALTVKYDSVKSILYERTSRPRYVSGLLVAWPLLFTKGKKHFMTIQYADESGSGKYVLFRLDKGNFREVLAKAEAETGKKVERSEER